MVFLIQLKQLWQFIFPRALSQNSSSLSCKKSLIQKLWKDVKVTLMCNGHKPLYAEEFSCQNATDQEAYSNDTEDQSSDRKLLDKRWLSERTLSGGLRSPKPEVPPKAILQRIDSKSKAQSHQLGHQLSLK
ncbi:IQ domain-containing protein [Nymphaea thermarum]|nr:IQ domain-containing protein [Nymphaea thermarum]